MTAALSDWPPADGWTIGDLDDLPDDGHRRELLDGVLLVSPTPTDFHQIIAMRLGVALEENCPADFQVTQGVEIRINTRRSFIPDVLVANDEAARRLGRHYGPHEVVLAVEIVSPTSVTMDRITKPALYAAAGIPFYWRIETEAGLAVHTHRLDWAHEIYQPAGTFTDTLATDQPWPINLPIERLRPKHL